MPAQQSAPPWTVGPAFSWGRHSANKRQAHGCSRAASPAPEQVEAGCQRCLLPSTVHLPPRAPCSNTGNSAYAIRVTAGRSDLGDATVTSVMPTTLNLQSLTVGSGGLKVTGVTK